MIKNVNVIYFMNAIQLEKKGFTKAIAFTTITTTRMEQATND